MSLILDALKKSEQERQREKAPGLQSIHQPAVRPIQKNNRWQWFLLLALVLINGSALIYWYTHTTPYVAPAAAVDSSPAPQSAIVTKQIEPAPSVQPSQRGDATTLPAAEYTEISPTKNRLENTGTAASRPIEEVGELPDEVRNNLPAMTFSFHVYSPNPQQRTIIINNRRMREGDEINPGVQLQEITEDGVILGYAQHRVHIGVLSGW